MGNVETLSAKLADRSNSIQTALVKTDGSDLWQADIADVNWRDVLRTLNDLLTSVSHEGMLFSPKVGKTLALAEMATAALSDSVSFAEARLERYDIGWFHRLLAAFPSGNGQRMRNIIVQMERDQRDVVELAEMLDKVTLKREEIGEALNRAMHDHLLANDEAYQRHAGARDKAASEHKMTEKGWHVHRADGAMVLYRQYGMTPELPSRLDGSSRVYQLLQIGFAQHAEKSACEMEHHDSCMRALRRQELEKVYQNSTD